MPEHATSANFHQDIIVHIQAVHQWQVHLMHSLIRVWFLNPSQLPNSQCGAYSPNWYKHQCCFYVDYILQILFVFYEKTLFKKRENKKNDISTVWILVGILDNGKKVCEQVGRTKDIINSLTEIKDNVKDFYRSDSKKYGTLKDKNYYVS